jgi:hypothetical protein
MRTGCEMTLNDAKANLAATFELAGRRPIPVLVDMREVRSQTREARQHFAGPEAQKVTLAVALLIGSPVSRVLANFYLGVRPPRIPTQLFTDEAEAVTWVLERLR